MNSLSLHEGIRILKDALSEDTVLPNEVRALLSDTLGNLAQRVEYLDQVVTSPAQLRTCAHRLQLFAAAYDQMRDPRELPESMKLLEQLILSRGSTTDLLTFYAESPFRGDNAPRLSPLLLDGHYGGKDTILLIDGNPPICQNPGLYGLLAHEAAHKLPSLIRLSWSGRHARRAVEYLCDLAGMAMAGPGFSRSVSRYISEVAEEEYLEADGSSHPAWSRRIDSLEHFSDLLRDEEWREWAVRSATHGISHHPDYARLVSDQSFSVAETAVLQDKEYKDEDLMEIELENEIVQKFLRKEVPDHPISPTVVMAFDTL